MRRHLLTILALPFVVVVVVPTLIVWIGGGWDVRWRVGSPAGLLLLGIGLALWLGGLLLTAWCIRLFARLGQGTLAPWDPTQRLVVVGPYRYVRNPMYLAVVSIIFGQAMILGSVSLLVYGTLVWLTFHLFVLAYEEPTLRKTFGTEYDAFSANVPRWVPRLSPWSGGTRQD